MKLISSLIATCLAFTYATNDTTTEEPTTTDMSTTMYTTTDTVIYVSKVYDKDSDPTNDFEECEYSWMGTFNYNEIDITLCGFTEDGMGYTAIKLEFPSQRWLVFGLSSSGSVSEDDTFSNYDGYNIIVPIESDDIQERYYMSDGDYDELEPTFTTISDAITDGRRTMRLFREQLISNSTGLNVTAADVDKYFNFEDFMACDDNARISVAYGPGDGQSLKDTGSRFTQETYGSREAEEITPEVADDGYDCYEDSGDDASHIMVFGAFIIGFIAILLF